MSSPEGLGEDSQRGQVKDRTKCSLCFMIPGDLELHSLIGPLYLSTVLRISPASEFQFLLLKSLQVILSFFKEPIPAHKPAKATAEGVRVGAGAHGSASQAGRTQPLSARAATSVTGLRAGRLARQWQPLGAGFSSQEQKAGERQPDHCTGFQAHRTSGVQCDTKGSCGPSVSKTRDRLALA